MEAVSTTAQWTAAIRATESAKGDSGLFNDELAKCLAEPMGFDLLEKYNAAGVRDFVAIRTRYNDDAILKALSSADLKQVVFVAAGMDTRSMRLDWPNDITIFEIDHEALLIEKGKRLSAAGAKAKSKTIGVAANLAGDWYPKLVESGFEANTPTLWIMEGLLFFLEKQNVIDLLKKLSEASANGSHLITDMPSEALLKSPSSLLFLATLKKDGIPWRFGCDDPVSFLADSGWNVTELKEPGEPGAGEKRWPYPVHSRDVKGVPRSWLIQAKNHSQI